MERILDGGEGPRSDLRSFASNALRDASKSSFKLPLGRGIE
jgi:hypothetical protein